MSMSVQETKKPPDVMGSWGRIKPRRVIREGDKLQFPLWSEPIKLNRHIRGPLGEKGINGVKEAVGHFKIKDPRLVGEIRKIFRVEIGKGNIDTTEGTIKFEAVSNILQKFAEISQNDRRKISHLSEDKIKKGIIPDPNFDEIVIGRLLSEEDAGKFLGPGLYGYLRLARVIKRTDVNFPSVIEEDLNTLTSREEGILKKRFGIGIGEPLDLERVGEIFGISRERVKQIEALALRKLAEKAKKGPSKVRTRDDSRLIAIGRKAAEKAEREGIKIEPLNWDVIDPKAYLKEEAEILVKLSKGEITKEEADRAFKEIEEKYRPKK